MHGTSPYLAFEVVGPVNGPAPFDEKGQHDERTHQIARELGLKCIEL